MKLKSKQLQRLLDDIRQTPVQGMTVSQGTVFSRPYHTVEPHGGSWLDMESWCCNTFGEPGSVWGDFTTNNRWYMNNSRFWFRDQKDLAFFLMKWS